MANTNNTMQDNETPRMLIEGFLATQATHHTAIPNRRRRSLRRTPQQQPMSGPSLQSETRSRAKLASSSDTETITPRTMIQEYMTAKTAMPSTRRKRERPHSETHTSESKRRSSVTTPFLKLNATFDKFTPRFNIEGFLQQAPQETPDRITSLPNQSDEVPDVPSVHDIEISVNMANESFRSPLPIKQGRTPKQAWKKPGHKSSQMTLDKFKQGVQQMMSQQGEKKSCLSVTMEEVEPEDEAEENAQALDGQSLHKEMDAGEGGSDGDVGNEKMSAGEEEGSNRVTDPVLEDRTMEENGESEDSDQEVNGTLEEIESGPESDRLSSAVEENIYLATPTVKSSTPLMPTLEPLSKQMSFPPSIAEELEEDVEEEEVEEQLGGTAENLPEGEVEEEIVSGSEEDQEGYDLSELKTPHLNPLLQRSSPALATPSTSKKVQKLQPQALQDKTNKAPPRKAAVRRRAPSTSIPASVVKQTFNHFCKLKVSKDAIAEVCKVSEIFWDNVAEDLEAFAEHAKRKTVDETDVELLMRRQGFITEKQSLNSLVEKYLPLELRQEIIPMARSGNKVTPL